MSQFVYSLSVSSSRIEGLNRGPRIRHHAEEDKMKAVKMTANGKIKCPGCGRKIKAEYRQQTPAPCGCDWVWENGRLIAVPHRTIK